VTKIGIIENEFRVLPLEVIAGDPNLVTEVVCAVFGKQEWDMGLSPLPSVLDLPTSLPAARTRLPLPL